MEGTRLGPSGLGSGGGHCGGQPRPRLGARRCLTLRSFRCSRTRHRRGSQPCPTPMTCDSSSSRELGGPGQRLPFSPGPPACPQSGRSRCHGGRPQGKASGSPRELPEREKVFPFLVGVREVGGGLAGGHGGPGAGRPQGFLSPAWGSLGVQPGGLWGSSLGGSDPLALPSPQCYL